MGQLVGAALVSHHPGLFQCEEIRLLMGNGVDSDLIAGYDRVRRKLDAARPDVLVIIDSHWFTTGYHLVDGGAHYSGKYLSDEMPWYLFGQHYDYPGSPAFARLLEGVARERRVRLRGVFDPDLGRHYPTINIVNKLRREEKIVSLSCCQNCRLEHFLESGTVLGEAIARSDARVAILASGALSHRFNDIDWVPKSLRIFDEVNVSRPENIASDKEAVALFVDGRHDLVLERWAERFRPAHWEASGGHYLQMLGAMGGKACRAKGTVLSAYENARGTGNIHVWFDVE
jgi:3,4-dihydroxyphenylacetate 2,3-dioxygenase